MRGLTCDELRCLDRSLPSRPDNYLDDAGIPPGTEQRLIARGLLTTMRGPDGDDDWCVATPVGVWMFALLTKGSTK